MTQNRVPCTLRPFFRPLTHGTWFTFASSHVAKNCASNISTLVQTWSLDYGTLKAMCTVHSAPGDQTLCGCSLSILLFRPWVVNWIINETSPCMNIISGWKFILFWHNGGIFTFHRDELISSALTTKPGHDHWLAKSLPQTVEKMCLLSIQLA